MDVFPEHIDRMICIDTLKKNQVSLTQKTREIFTKSITDALKNSDKSVKLFFDDRLWTDGRVKITIELLQRFGEIKFVTKQGNIEITRITNKTTDIPTDITAIIIEFMN